MRNGSGFRFMAALAMFILVGLFAIGAFGAGIAVGVASDTTSWTAGSWHAGQVVSFLITILVVIVLFRLILGIFFGFGYRRRMWGRRGYWHGYWHGRSDFSGYGPVSAPFGPGSAPFGPGSAPFGPGSAPFGQSQFGKGPFGPDAPHGGFGEWQRSDWRDAGQAAFNDFHNRAHSTPPTTTPTEAANSGTGTSANAGNGAPTNQ
jgi:hypothetical protein